MILFIMTCPIAYNISVGNLREFQEKFFQVTSMCLIALFAGNIWISLFLILNILLFLYSGGNVGMNQVMNVFLGTLLFIISRSFFSKNKFEDYSKYILWILALNILWMIFQAIGIDPIYIGQDAAGERLLTETFRNNIGLFGIKMANGIFITLCLPIIASLNIWIVPLLAIPLYFCRSSIVALSVFVSASFFLYHMRRKLFFPFILTGLIGGGIYIAYDLKDDPQTFYSRFPVWHSAIKFSTANPLGYGPDSYRNFTKQKNFLFMGDEKYRHAIAYKVKDDALMFKYYDPDNGKMERDYNGITPKDINWWDNAHSEYLQMLFEYGFFGIFLLLGLMKEMYRRFKYTMKDNELVTVTSCLLVYFVSGIGHFPFHLARLAFLFPILLGIFYAKTEGADV